MMNIKVGNVLNFAYADNLFAKLILFRNRFYFGSPYTHSAIVTKVDAEFIEVAEALGEGFTISNYERWWVEAKINSGVIDLGQVNAPLRKVRECAQKYVGTAYGWSGIFYIALSLLGKKSYKWSDGVKSLICSEAVARILYDASAKEINFETEFNKPYDEITPDDLSYSKQIDWKVI